MNAYDFLTKLKKHLCHKAFFMFLTKLNVILHVKCNRDIQLTMPSKFDQIWVKVRSKPGQVKSNVEDDCSDSEVCILFSFFFTKN